MMLQIKADVQSNETTKNGDTYYIAGNVGGIVGKAMDTNMENVTNEESNIRGAHNVGGIAGYFGNTDNIASGTKYNYKKMPSIMVETSWEQVQEIQMAM